MRDVYRMVRERQEREEEEKESARRRIERRRRQSRRFSILLTPIAVFTTVFTAALGVQTTKCLGRSGCGKCAHQEYPHMLSNSF